MINFKTQKRSCPKEVLINGELYVKALEQMKKPEASYSSSTSRPGDLYGADLEIEPESDSDSVVETDEYSAVKHMITAMHDIMGGMKVRIDRKIMTLLLETEAQKRINN